MNLFNSLYRLGVTEPVDNSAGGEVDFKFDKKKKAHREWIFSKQVLWLSHNSPRLKTVVFCDGNDIRVSVAKKIDGAKLSRIFFHGRRKKTILMEEAERGNVLVSVERESSRVPGQ